MNAIAYLKAAVMGAVEGLTEFLPVSSTGHLILTADLIGFEGPLESTFEVAIQLGAILAVCWLYRTKIGTLVRGAARERAAQRFLLNLALAFLPAAALGYLYHDEITHHLFNPRVVAWALIAGGLLILAVERWHEPVDVVEVEAIDWRHALKIGLAQTLALIPGASRSAATIVGGVLFGLSRKAATEFSFFLAIPTMLAATGYDVYKNLDGFDAEQLGLFAVGFLVAFASALLAVKGFLRYVAQHDFSLFAWYRILFGAAVLYYYG